MTLQVIAGKRGCGKTTELITRASKDKARILVPTKHQVNFVMKKAHEMGIYDLPHPITIGEYLSIERTFINDKLYIDNVDDVFRRIFKTTKVVTLNTK